MASLVERYRSGAHEEVWAELQAHGSAVQREPLRTAALTVAHETMQRARHNVMLLRTRLDEVGYRFAYPDEVLVPPGPNDIALIQQFEQNVGPLPMSLRVWYEIVGSVNFIGMHPDWDPEVHTDPLVVDPLSFALEEYQEWRECCASYGVEEIGPYQVPVAPDDYFKADLTGRPQRRVVSYTINIEQHAVDAPVGDEPHHTTFVNYLRTCFRWGGFPGFERVEQRPDKVLAYLTSGLLRI